MWKITTAVGITRRGHGCECGIYARFIVIDPYIGTNLLYGGGGRIEFLVREGGQDQSYQVANSSNNHAVLILFSLVN